MKEQYTILLLDDDIDFLEQMKLVLENEGYKVVTGDGLKAGEKIIETLKPDLAITDLMMEHYDSGFVFSYKIKKKYPEVPVILATAVAAETGTRFSCDPNCSKDWSKADLVMDKGIRYDQLIREVKRLIKG